MFLSLFLIIIFLVMTFFQIYFLGLYFAVTQQAFVNQKFAVLASGFVIYFFLTFVAAVPFYFFQDPNYIRVAFVIKDVFIILFLINRRDLFKRHKLDLVSHLLILLIAMTIILSFFYIGPLVQRGFNPLTTGGGNHFFLVRQIKNYLHLVTFSNRKQLILYYYLYPLMAAGMVTITAAFYSAFMKFSHYPVYPLTLITLVLVTLFFHHDGQFANLFSIILLLFLFQNGVNVITYSRRRYLIMFGFGTIVTHALNFYLALAVITLTLCLIFVYIILRRPRASFFATQLAFPVLIMGPFWVTSSSTTWTLILILIILALYISLFYFARFQIIQNNLILRNLNFIFLFLGSITLFFYSIVKISIWKNLGASFLWTSMTFLRTFNNYDLAIVVNVIYYFFFLATAGLVSYYFATRKRMVGTRLTLLVCLLVFIFAYNPLVVKALLSSSFAIMYIEKLAIISIVPVFMIMLVGFIRRMLKTVPALFDLSKRRWIFHSDSSIT